jgi:hypothetical protein
MKIFSTVAIYSNLRPWLNAGVNYLTFLYFICPVL